MISPKRRLILSFVTAGGAVGVIAMVMAGRDDSSAPLPSGPTEYAPGSSPATLEAPRDEPSPASSQSSRRLSSASPGEEPPRFLLVIDGQDNPVTSALAVWTPLTEEVLRAAQREDFALVAAARLVARSDYRGRISFPAPPFSEMESSALWVWSERHLPHLILLGEGRDRAWGTTVELAKCDLIRATVLGGSGSEEPRVLQHALPDQRVLDVDVARSREVFFVETGCDGGSTPLVRFPGRTSVRASEGTLVSPVWMGDLTGDLTLELRTSFVADGLVDLGSGVLADQLAVSVTHWDAHLSRQLGPIPVGHDGSLVRTRVPFFERGEYEFRLDGGNAIPDSTRLTVPDPQTEPWIELEARAGSTLWVYIGDQEGEPIGSATATMRHTDQARRELTVVQPVFPEGDWKGYARFEGVPDGSAQLAGDAPGYGRATTGPLTIPGDLGYSWDILLGREAFLRGRVTFDGAPVPEFEICYWNDQRQGSAARQAFHSRAEGTFELSIPAGDVHVLATSPEHPRSDIIKVSVEPEGTREVNLELSRAHELRGRVVDILTGAGIEGAEVQLWSSHLHLIVAPWGAPFVTAPDGRFVAKGIVPGRNTVFVRAPGYSSTFLDALLVDESLDVGLIAMRPTQPLDIQLTGLGPGEYTGYTMDITGPHPVADVTFDPDGFARLHDAPGGSLYLVVGRSDRTEDTRTRIHLEPGSAWRVVIPVGGGAELDVQAVPPKGDIPSGLNAAVTRAFDEGDYWDRVIDLNEEGTGKFTGLAPGKAFVRLLSDGRVRGTAIVDLAKGSNRIAIPLSSATTEIQVVDGHGKPIPSAGVHIDHPAFSGIFFPRTTDEFGLCSFEGYADGDYFLQIVHPTLGCRSGVPLHIDSTDDRPHTVVLDAQAEVRLRLVDSKGAVGGARCELHALNGMQRLLWRTSDAAGEVYWARMTEGEYRLEVMHPRYWLVSQTISAGVSGEPTEVRVLGLGDVRFELRGPGASRDEIVLESRSSGSRAGDWLAERRIRSSTGSMIPDEEGNLTLLGLPEGNYTWSLGDATTGGVRIEAGAVAAERILLAEE